MEKKCVFCKRTISIDDNYCPYCGYFLKDASSSSKKGKELKNIKPKFQDHQATIPLEEEKKEEYSEPEIEEKKQEEMEPEITTKIKEEETKIPEEIIEQYYIRIQLKKCEEDLKKYKEKIDNFLSNLNEQELEEVKDEIPALEESINKLKQKKSSLLAQKKTLPQEDILEERNKLKKQISNLENKFHLKEIEPNVYEELKSEYETKLKEINTDLKDKYHFEKNWKKLLQKDIEKQQQQLKTLEGRFKVGELSKTNYENEKNNINKNIEKLSLLLSELKF